MARPRWQPTPADREKIAMMTALGIPQASICAVFKIAEKTLRRAYRHELDTGLAEANAQVGRALFDGGRISSNGGVMLLARADRRLGIAERLARAIPDGRDPDRVTHLPDILHPRIFAFAGGYEDADDLDRLRFDPAFKLACGRLPDSDRDLCSRPTVSRWENAPDLRDLIRLTGVMVDLYSIRDAGSQGALTGFCRWL